MRQNGRISGRSQGYLLLRRKETFIVAKLRWKHTGMVVCAPSPVWRLRSPKHASAFIFPYARANIPSPTSENDSKHAKHTLHSPPFPATSPASCPSSRPSTAQAHRCTTGATSSRLRVGPARVSKHSKLIRV